VAAGAGRTFGKGQRKGPMNWHKWYHSTWLASLTRAQLDLAARGLYRDLLDFHYQERGIPDNRDMLIRIAATTPAEFDRSWKQIKDKFQPDLGPLLRAALRVEAFQTVPG
jgi:hypothetical protein